MYSSLDARATVRVSLARDLLTRPACGRPNARTRRLHHPRHVASLHVPSRRRRTWGGLCDLAPGVRRRTNATGALRRRADAAARETRRIQFARALASQRPPSRERLPRGAGQGRTISPSLSLAPPLSVDRRRGAPSSSSKRSARVQLCWDITQRGRGRGGLMQRITFVGARPAAGR